MYPTQANRGLEWATQLSQRTVMRLLAQQIKILSIRRLRLAFGKARLTDRRAGRRWLFCREKCKQRDSDHAKDHNVLGTILPVHPMRHGLRRHDGHREPMGKA